MQIKKLPRALVKKRHAIGIFHFLFHYVCRFPMSRKECQETICIVTTVIAFTVPTMAKLFLNHIAKEINII